MTPGTWPSRAHPAVMNGAAGQGRRWLKMTGARLKPTSGLGLLTRKLDRLEHETFMMR